MTTRVIKMCHVHRFTLSLSLLVALGATPFARGLDPSRKISQYGHSVWRIQDGVVARSAAVAQTTDGYIWLAQYGGLVRFDGVRFVPWQPPNDQHLPSKRSTALLGARDGSLWIGTSGGISRLKDGRLQHYTDEAVGAGISAIIEDKSGTIWFTRYRLQGRGGPLCSVSGGKLRCYGKNDGIPASYGLGLVEDDSGYIWFGSKVLYRWKPGSPPTTYLSEAFDKNPTTNGVVDLAKGPAGSLWATIADTGPALGVRHFSNGKWSDYVMPGFNGPTVWSEALLHDRQGSLWVGTQNDGLYRIHNSVADHYRISDGLSGNSISSFFEDREGNIWVVTDGGLDMFRDTPVVSITTREGLSTASVTNVLALHDGNVWIGTEHGIDQVDPTGNLTRRFAKELGEKTVTALLEDHNGSVWFGADNRLEIYRSGRLQEIRNELGQAFAGTGTINGIAEDSSDVIWILTSGKKLYRADRNQVPKEVMSIADPDLLRFLVADSKRGVWIGADKGRIFHFVDGKLQAISLTDAQGPLNINGMGAESDGSLFVSTGRGLYDWDADRFRALTVANGLPCDTIYAALTDNHGDLWLNAECGILKVDESELRLWRENSEKAVAVTQLDAFDGAHPSHPLNNEPSFSKGPDGRLWFYAGSMIQVVDPNKLHKDTIPPPVVIEGVAADRKPLNVQASLRIPPLTRDLQIDYTALSFTVPQKVRFRYMLEGHDEHWLDAGTRRQAFYTDLKPGKYRFRVIASNGSGVWNDNGASLNFTILPAYYQTLWFKLVVAGFVLLTLWLAYQLRVRRLHRQFEIGLEARVAERTRIARDLHDTLLQSFQGALLYFQSASNLLPHRPEEAKNKLDKAIDEASDAIAEARGAVAGLRASSPTATSDLAVSIRSLGESLRTGDSTPKAPSLDVVLEGEPRKLDPMVGDEIYRIAVEALRNAFRHAGASRIEVEIRYDDKQLRVRIRDDGRGIDPETAEESEHSGHYGLHGMKERAELMGGKLEVWSDVHSGTEIEVTVPSSRAYQKQDFAQASLRGR